MNNSTPLYSSSSSSNLEKSLELTGTVTFCVEIYGRTSSSSKYLFLLLMGAMRGELMNGGQASLGEVEDRMILGVSP